jgi:hypothetical protein
MDLPDAEPASDSTAANHEQPDVVRSMLPAARPASTTTEQHADAGKVDHTKISFARFDPNAGLFGMVARLLRQRSAAMVRVRGIPVLVLLPAQDKALLLQPLDSLQALCAPPARMWISKPIPTNPCQQSVRKSARKRWPGSWPSGPVRAA